MLFVLWEGVQHRETRDLDLLGFGEKSAESLIQVFGEICATAVPDDGLEFGSITASSIIAVQEYGGVTVKIQAKLGQARILINVDVGFGDKVTPRAKMVDFPALLDFPSPRVRAYPIETVIAEKLHALVALGPKNSRMKDFFDLGHLARTFEFDGKVLCEAIRGTFERRRTLIPQAIPTGLTPEFALEKQTLWKAFLTRSEQAGERQFVAVVEGLHGFLVPPFKALAEGHTFKKHWPKCGPWIGI